MVTEKEQFNARSDSGLEVTIIKFQEYPDDETPGLFLLKTSEGLNVNDNNDGSFTVLNHPNVDLLETETIFRKI